MHLPFNFQLIENAWDAGVLAQLIRAHEASLSDFGWPNWALGSHDAPRIAARTGEAKARVAAMLLSTLRGTPTLYQGDELGIGEVPIRPERVRDPQDLRQPGLGIGRDRSRTPTPWGASPHAGLSDVDPWLPLNPDWQTQNVTAQSGDPEPMLSLYRRLLALLRQHAALAVGRMRAVGAQDEILSYERSLNGDRLLVALNMGGERRPLVYPPGKRP